MAKRTTTEPETTRRVKMRRTVGKNDCQRFGLPVDHPPRESEIRELPADVADRLVSHALADPA